jgi:hypothetical protein
MDGAARPRAEDKSMPNHVTYDQPLPDIQRSTALYERARKRIPAGTQTLAKGPTQYVDGVAPKYLVRGRGARVWDADGNEYLDLTMAVGPVVLGYGHAAVDAAIRRQLDDGITFSLMHPLEVEVAELCHAVVPGADRVRFSKTGCDVTSAAVRLARAYTGRDRVLCCGYHGWHDWYVGTTTRARGVPHAMKQLTQTFQYNDLYALLEALDESVACVILINQTIEFLPIVLLGAAPEVALMKATLDAVWGMYIHSNLNVKTGALQYVINGPEMHRWHHARDLPAPGKNFATKLAIWDFLFGTAHRPDEKPARYGSDDERYPKFGFFAYVRQHWYAFRR